MSLRKVLFIFSLVISMLCLVGGYGFSGHWIGVGVALLAGPAWLLARKYPASGLPSICLLAFVGLAVAGQLTGSPPLLMTSGSGFALAAWDLLCLDIALGNCAFGEQTRHYESNHLRSLALALGFGLLVVFLGHFLNLQVPFFILVLFIVLAIFGLDRIWGYIKKRSTSTSQ